MEGSPYVGIGFYDGGWVVAWNPSGYAVWAPKAYLGAGAWGSSIRLRNAEYSYAIGCTGSFDYVTIGFGWFEGLGGGFHLTLDRYGALTWGGGGGVGLGGKGFGIAWGTYGRDPARGGAGIDRDARASPELLRQLNTGLAVNVSSAFGLGIGVAYPYGQPWTATEPQISLPGAGLAVGYSWEIGQWDSLAWEP